MSLSSTEVDENQTIRQVLGGDATAFGLLVRSHQQRLFSILMAMLGNREDAEDLTQEAFAKAFLKLDTFQGRSSFFTWLSRIAMNLVYSHRRKYRREKSIARTPIEFAADEILHSEPTVVEQSMANEQSEQIRMAILRLDEERRSVLVLRDVDGMDYEAIAEMLDIPIGTVRSRLHRARMELRDIIVTLVPSLFSTEDAAK